MKIYTEVNWQWDDILKKYIEISSNSFEYGGDLDLAADDDEGGDDDKGPPQPPGDEEEPEEEQIQIDSIERR